MLLDLLSTLYGPSGPGPVVVVPVRSQNVFSGVFLPRAHHRQPVPLALALAEDGDDLALLLAALQ